MITIFLQRKNVKRRVAKEVLFRICLRETSSWFKSWYHIIFDFTILPFCKVKRCQKEGLLCGTGWNHDYGTCCKRLICMKESFFGDYGKCRRPSNYQKHFIVLFNTQTYSRNYDYNLTQSKQIANASIVDVESDMELVVVPQDQCVNLEDAKNQNLDQVIINFMHQP